jgi:hypothetical protein
LGGAKTEIFFQKGLDSPNQIEKSQQIRRCAQRRKAGGTRQQPGWRAKSVANGGLLRQSTPRATGLQQAMA